MKTTLLVLAVLAAGACTANTSEQESDSATLGRSAPVEAPNSQGRPMKNPTELASETALSRSIVLLSGGRERTLWISDDVVVEFQPDSAGRDALLRSDAAAEELGQPQKGVRLWRVAAGLGTDSFARNASLDAPRFSAVLHETQSPRSPMLAPKGGVIATFPSTWTRAQVDTWLAARGLSVSAALVEGVNMVRIDTAPGLEAIELAIRLVESGELVDCEPDLWREASKR